MSSNVKIPETTIYLLWAYQGVLMDEINVDDDSNIMIHISIPSSSIIRDLNNEILAGDNLFKKVKDVSDILTMSMKFNQGVNVKFIIEPREDDWTKLDAQNALMEMMRRLISGNPFQEVV